MGEGEGKERHIRGRWDSTEVLNACNWSLRRRGESIGQKHCLKREQQRSSKLM